MIASHIDISKAQSILGWMSDRELMWLAKSAQDKKCIVEFGCFRGRSTRALADNTQGKIYAVDPWAPDYIMEDNNEKLEAIDCYVMPYFYQNLDDYIRSGKVIPCRTYSDRFVLPVGIFADMVFIDGDHCYSAVRKDVQKAIYELTNLHSSILICGHDYAHPSYPGVKDVVDEVMFPLAVKKGVEDTIWWAIL